MLFGLVLLYRYVVRVLATDKHHETTNIKWETMDGTVTGSQMVLCGDFVQITNPLASQVMKISCQYPCLVMQYNTGRVL